MTLLTIRIPGQPQGKGRARSARLKNGMTIHYTPERTRTYEGMIRTQAIQAMGAVAPTHLPVSLCVECVYQVPASWPAWKRDLALSGAIAPTVKPDSDNVLKAVKDALNGVVWNDDCQAVVTTQVKVYGTVPGVTVAVSTLGNHPAQIKKRPA